MNRRDFLRALAAAGITMPSLPGMADDAASNGAAEERARHLILIELQGGNDGLNTVAPFADPEYKLLRPKIGLKREQVLQLDETTGLHNALDPLMKLWKSGDMAVVQGVGYPAPNRSHFRSIEIWETASNSDETLVDGWLKPVTDAMPQHNGSPIKALVLGGDEGPLAGATYDTIVFNNLNGFVRQARNIKISKDLKQNKALSHILAVENTTRSAARVFAQRLDSEQAAAEASALPKKSPKLVKQLDLIARLIREDVGPQIYKVSLGSFDTHANQTQRHAGLLKQFAEGVAHLEKSLADTGHWRDVLVMTYSEFGRRAGENGSNGTDHGTAAPHFVMGGSVKGGLYGQPPDLDKLERKDVLFTTDFREVYSTVSRNWFGQTLQKTPYSEYDALPILKRV